MKFGNEAGERHAQSRVLEFKRNLLLLMDELKKYKHQNSKRFDEFFSVG
ncbi:hypothetical protein MtrunA17_Chr8g0337301 [Medicago truncatula]|uniref:Uncharacterized protein n=1 Tax=Medicago truncatula TaxID=3880 RepID=A0A072TLB5_MEDTR|nr:hypothetical protein MTR_8g009760 [Medicago truncatula]RHN38821.1 hypothetical protein MtrunA17_Chr8g0337301 [Medicago truncatula]